MGRFPTPQQTSSLIPFVMVTRGISTLFALGRALAIAAIAGGFQLWCHGGGCVLTMWYRSHFGHTSHTVILSFIDKVDLASLLPHVVHSIY
jgi:hypothetical protein